MEVRKFGSDERLARDAVPLPPFHFTRLSRLTTELTSAAESFCVCITIPFISRLSDARGLKLRAIAARDSSFSPTINVFDQSLNSRRVDRSKTRCDVECGEEKMPGVRSSAETLSLRTC